MALDLVAAAAPAPDPPVGVDIVSWADRPDLIRGLYEVYREAEPDIPGEEDAEMPPFEKWLAKRHATGFVTVRGPVRPKG